MNFWIEGKRSAVEAVLAKVHGVIINDEEGELLTYHYTIASVAKALQAYGPRVVVLKRGEHGAILFNGNDIFYVPAYPLELVIDPTGAGDTFAGGFMGYLARHGDLTSENLRGAMLAGSVMASFCVEGFGLSRLRLVDLSHVRERYAKFVEMTRSPGSHPVSLNDRLAHLRTFGGVDGPLEGVRESLTRRTLDVLARPRFSQLVGSLAQAELPAPLVQAVIRWYIGHYGVDESEMEHPPSHYRSFDAFFSPVACGKECTPSTTRPISRSVRWTRGCTARALCGEAASSR